MAINIRHEFQRNPAEIWTSRCIFHGHEGCFVVVETGRYHLSTSSIFLGACVPARQPAERSVYLIPKQQNETTEREKPLKRRKQAHLQL